MPLIGIGGNEPPQLLQKGGTVKRYKVTINGVDTELQLTDEDAKARGLLKSETKAEPKAETKSAKAPANKSRSAANKA